MSVSHRGLVARRFWSVALTAAFVAGVDASPVHAGPVHAGAPVHARELGPAESDPLIAVAEVLAVASEEVRAAELEVRTHRAGMVCPVAGPLWFYDDFGNARSRGRRHKGNDIVSPYDTPNVAVVDGRVEFKNGSRQGKGAYLRGDDGNEYWYFHLAAYAGEPRRVRQGDVIGYTGSTGNAGGAHTHFEVHPDADPDDVANPYPLLDFVCIDRAPRA